MATTSPISLSNLCEDIIMLIADHLESCHAEHDTPLKQLSLTNRRLRDVLVPVLFKSVHINQPLSQLTPTPLVKYHARSCQIDMFGSKWWWCSGSYVDSKDALDLFRCIQGMDNITSLYVTMMSRSIDIFEEAFRERSTEDDDIFTLDHVEKLIVTNSAAFLTSHCPNLKSLVIEDESDYLIETYAEFTQRLQPLAGRMANFEKHQWPPLETCDITAAWSLNEVVSLAVTFPRLRFLRLRSTWHCYRAATKDIVKVLGEALPQLRTLHLVNCSWLSMGVQSIWKRRIRACSNAEYRRMLWLENERLRVQVENDVARSAFESISSLDELWLGDKRVARRLPKEYNSGCLKWMWERAREDESDCSMGDGLLALWKMERDAAVVTTEVGL